MAAEHGEAVGRYATALLGHAAAVDQDAPGLPAARLVKKWGAGRVEQACRRALEAEAVDVNLVSRMLERAREADEPRRRP